MKRGADVHRAAIDADEALRFANEVDQLKQRRLIREIETIVGRKKFSVRSSDKDDTGRGEQATEFADDGVG